MRVIGAFVLPDHTGNVVPMRYLSLLESFNVCGGYSWCSALLADLYREMCKATSYTLKEIGGCTWLLMVWAYTRIPGFGPQNPGAIDEGLPLGARYKNEFCTLYTI